MYKKLTYFIWVMVLFFQQACTQNIDYSDEKFETLIDREYALLKYAKKAQESKGEKRKKYLIKYFKAFPSDFETFFKINHKYYKDTMYSVGNPWDYAFAHNPWGKFYPVEEVVKTEAEVPKEKVSARFKNVEANLEAYEEAYIKWIDEEWGGDYTTPFYEIKKIMPLEIYYRKMISVGIGGFSDGEDWYHHKLGPTDDNPLYIKLLEERTDDELASIFYFKYDGPHPSNYQEYYEYKYQVISKLSPRVAELMKKAYERLLSEEHCEGH
jgi:hypothetical protein